MGQEILYCYKCQTRLLGSEFEKGKAFKIGGKAACPVCAKDLLASMPEAQIDQPRKIHSSTRIPAASPDSSSKFKAANLRAAPPAPPPGKSKNGLIIGAVVAAVVVLLLLAMAAGSGKKLVRSESAPQESPLPAAPSAPIARPPDPFVPSAPTFGNELRELDEKMRTTIPKDDFRQAAEFLDAARKRHPEPEWLASINERLPQVEARAKHAATPLREKALDARARGDAAEVTRIRDIVAAWGFAAVLAEFESALAAPLPPPTPAPAPAPVPEASGPPFVIYADALAPGCRDHSWDATVDFASTETAFEGARSISFAPKKKFAGLYLGIDAKLDSTQYPFVTFAVCPLEDKVSIAVTVWADNKKSSTLLNLDKLGGAPKTREWKKYVVPVSAFTPSDVKVHAIVFQSVAISAQPIFCVDSVAFLRGAPGASPPAPAPAPKELETYRARWSQAAAKAALRDYAGAQRDLEEGSAALKDEAAKAEAAADLELLKLAAQVPGEAAKAIEKWTKGQKVRLDFLNGAGERESAEGTVLSADAVRVSLQRESGTFDLPSSELLPSALAEIFRGRGDKKAADAKAAAAFCLFEGDEESGRKHWGAEGAPIPEKLLGAAKVRPAAEAAERQLFWAAEADFASPKRRFAAIEKYSGLAAGEPTPFAARLRPFVAARFEAARDTVFLADDLSAAGTFTLAGSAKTDACWSSSADSAVTKARENYVEAEFHAFAGLTYRAWIWAGACCQETFDYSLQGSELSAPNPKSSKDPLPCEPGGENALTGKPPTITLRKWHAQHGGPKEPSRWDWIPVTLPKYETAGPKKLRVLTAQQGFSVGAIVISAVRRDTPREAEIKDLEKSRFGSRKSVNTGPQGFILYEYWSGIDGSNVEDLTKHPSFSGKPAGWSFKELFEGPRDFADRFGSRMRGYVHPPATGNYTFWIASDDGGELWLSIDDQPVKRRLIASCPTAAGFRDWTRTPSCKSAPVVLTAGKRYYIEALHKEGNGNDHVAVGWTLPDGTEERPIPGSRLSPWSTGAVLAGPPGTVFYRALNLGGPPTIIDGRKWEGKAAPNHGVAGETVENQAVPLNPPTDDARAAMIRCFAFQRGSSAVKMNAVPPGTYHVFLYVWEDNFPQVFDLFVQGKEVVKGYNSGPAGHWDRLGPWTAVVTDGVIEVKSAGGDANFSGLEVWKLGK
jgi:hypothetical protein